MRKKESILLILVLFISIYSCKKDSKDESTPITPTPVAEMKCLLNGTSISFSNPNVSVTVGHTIGGGDSLHSIIINLLHDSNPGSYYIHPWSGVGFSHPYGYYNFFEIDSGNITITDTTGHKIKGTFYFKSGLFIGTEGTFQNLTLP